MLSRIIALAFLVAGSLPTIAYAQPYPWLRNSPIQHFNDEDWEMLRSTARDTLDNAADGATRSWRNDATGSSGSIKIISSFEQDGQRCREAEFLNRARSLYGGGVFHLCKLPDGQWKLDSR